MDKACSCGGHEATHIAPNLPKVTADQTVAQAARRPGALETMQRLGVNHCCGAGLTLTEAAAAAGIPLATLLAELEKAGAPA